MAFETRRIVKEVAACVNVALMSTYQNLVRPSEIKILMLTALEVYQTRCNYGNDSVIFCIFV